MRGTPAGGVAIVLSRLVDGRWVELASRVTDADGRVADLATTAEAGDYRLTFDTGTYFGTTNFDATFYPEVIVSFRILDAAAHHHVPLLLSPYAYSTYRGS